MVYQQGSDCPIRELALFAGAGGGILGGKLLGWRTVCAVEIEEHQREVLLGRQNDFTIPPFPVWDDVRTFDGRHWRGIVDVVSGGFPCQGISVAGQGLGLEDPRSGLWKEFARVICEVEPDYAFVENSPALTARGLGTVLGDLAAMGYDARWGVVSAADAIWLGGTPCLDHLRERIWIIAFRPDADADKERRRKAGRIQHHGPEERSWGGGEAAPNGGGGRCGEPEGRQIQQPGRTEAIGSGEADADCCFEESERREPREGYAYGTGTEGSHWWGSEPGVDRMVHGVAHRVDRIRAIGNGQVPEVVRLAWHLLGPGRQA